MKRTKNGQGNLKWSTFLVALFVFGGTIMNYHVPGRAEQQQVPEGAQIKEPAVAGGFYPADSAELAHEIDGYLKQAKPELYTGDRPVALLVPHAGIFYSGGVAGYSYRLLQDIQPQTIILIGPSHYVSFQGVAVYDRGYFRTPLGLLPVDTVLARKIAAQAEDIRFFPAAFGREHNIEVQLPFIQRVCPNAKIVPLIMGSQSAADVRLLREVLVGVLREHDAFLIGSTDLSHFYPATRAIKLDEVCMADVRSLDGEQLLQHLRSGKTEMCGGGPAAVVILTARELGADVGRVLKYGDSGDVGPQDKSRVVGYLAAALVDTTARPPEKKEKTGGDKGDVMELSEEQKTRLLTVARESIEHFLTAGAPRQWSNDDPELAVPSGAFVTLKKYGQLRGCIGHVEATSPLLETVAVCAVSSAVRDPRFRPVDISELPDLHIEISVMTPPAPIASIDDIVVGRDGLIIEKGLHRGLLLPQVPIEWGWNRDEYLRHLCNKAGLGPDEYKSGATILSFQALVFGESKPAH